MHSTESAMRAIVIVVVALVVAFGLGYIADIYWHGGSYTRMIVHTIGQVIAVLVNNW
jgi:hypothetical protein